MGTRADFYVGRGESAEWLGSIALDGYPDGKPKTLILATTVEQYRRDVEQLMTSLDHATRPEQGWPWPWDNSQTTDYAYAFDEGRVLASCFGGTWFCPAAGEQDPDDFGGLTKAIFPNMKARQKVTFGERSGLIVAASPEPQQE